MNLPKDFKGECFGVRVSERSNEDHHLMLTILVEDDEHWYETDTGMDSFWIDDLIEQLQITKNYLEKFAKKEKTGGYKRR